MVPIPKTRLGIWFALIITGILAVQSTQADSTPEKLTNRVSGEIKLNNVSPDNDALPLRMGLLPYLNPESLVSTFEPLITHLEEHLKRKIIVSSAPTFGHYLKRVIRGDYDFCLISPHLGALAIIDHQYQPLARWSGRLHGVYIVRKSDKYKSVQDLKGKKFSMPPRKAMISLIGILDLEENNILMGNNPPLQFMKSHNNALISVAAGTHDVAITGANAYKIVEPKWRNKLRLLARTKYYPHMMFLAKPDTPKYLRQQIKTALFSFNHTKAGEKFFLKTAYKGIMEVSKSDVEKMKPIVKLLKELKDK